MHPHLWYKDYCNLRGAALGAVCQRHLQLQRRRCLLVCDFAHFFCGIVSRRALQEALSPNATKKKAPLQSDPICCKEAELEYGLATQGFPNSFEAMFGRPCRSAQLCVLCESLSTRCGQQVVQSAFIKRDDEPDLCGTCTKEACSVWKQRSERIPCRWEKKASLLSDPEMSGALAF